MYASDAMAQHPSVSAGRVDTDLVSLALVMNLHGKTVEPKQLAYELGLRSTARMDELLLDAKRLELKAKLCQLDVWRAGEGRSGRGADA